MTQSQPLLLVEDHAETARAMARLLASRGWDVFVASGVAEALEAVETLGALGATPRCVVLDLDLPDGDGEAVLRHVRSAGLAARVVVCSAWLGDGRDRGVTELGADAVFVKPVEVERILAACEG